MTKKSKIIFACGAIAVVVVVALVVLFLRKPEEEEKIPQLTYEIIFNSSGGTTIAQQTVKEGEMIQKPKDPTKEGYIFVEWRYNGAPFDFNTKIEENMILTAKWEESTGEVEKITIKFDTDGGTTIANQIIEKDSQVTKPQDPTKEGYKFKGWFNNNKEFDFETKLSKDTELVAKWEKEEKTEKDDSNTSSTTSTVEKEQKKYTVAFNTTGGSSVASQSIVEGKKATKPQNPTKTGYTFTGWTLNGSTFDFNTAIKKNITLVATWKEVPKKNYTVAFNTTGGTSIASQTVTEGGKATKPQDPTKAGYVFAGWTLNGSTYNFNNAVTGNITLVAKWTQKSYSVVANKVDNISPQRVLTAYEDGKVIKVQEFQYIDEVFMCSGSSPNINYNAIKDEKNLILVLENNTKVTASLTIIN